MRSTTWCRTTSLLERKSGRSQAPREAQLALLRGKLDHPRDWAAFLLSGVPDAMPAIAAQASKAP